MIITGLEISNLKVYPTERIIFMVISVAGFMELQTLNAVAGTYHVQLCGTNSTQSPHPESTSTTSKGSPMGG